MTHALSPFQLLFQSLQRFARTATLSIAAAIMLAFAAPKAEAQCLPDLSPNATEVCVGQGFSITSSPLFAGGSLTWRRNGVVVQVGGLTFTRAAAVAGDAGSYTLQNVNGFPFGCNNISAAVTVVVATPLAFTVQPVSTTVCGGANIGLTVANTGSPTNYRWRRNAVNLVNGVNANGTTITGALTASLSLSSIDPADAGSYTCVINNDCSSLVSSTAFVSVRTPAAFTLQPVASANCQGDTVNFTVTAVGTTPLALQWRRNGVNLVNGLNVNGTLVAGATGPSLTLTGVALADSGSYSCTAANLCNTAFSFSAPLTVAGSPVITNPPDDFALCFGGNASFTVAASSPGGGLLTFRWRRDGVNLNNGVNGIGTTLAGVTTTTLSLTSVATGDAGTYTCVVTNSCPTSSTTISPGAVLTVNTGSAIFPSPPSRAACELGSTSFFVGVIAGSPSPTVQWQFNGVNLVNGVGVSGATTTTLTLSFLNPGDAGNYRAIVTSLCGSVTSGTAVLTINPQVQITTSPVSQTVCQFANVTFSVVASGFAPISYRWIKDGVDLADGAGVSGSGTPMLTLSSVGRSDSGSYQCRVSNVCDTDFTSARTLTVQDVQIQSSGLNQVVCSASVASFTIVADGTPAPSFQWRFNGVSIANGVNANFTTVSGATTATLTLTSVAVADAGSYSCAVSNLCDTDISTSRTLTVDTGVTVTSPVATTVCEGNLAAFSVTVTGSPAPTLQWQRNSVNLVNGVNANGTTIGGATTTTLTLASVDPLDAGTYRIVVTNLCDTDITSSAALTVNLDTRIATSPPDRTVCPGANTTFTVAGVTGTAPITFQWRRNLVNLVNGVNGNGTTISGATSPTLTLTSVAAADAGSYTCVVAGACSTAVSLSAALLIGTPVVLTTQPLGSTQCAGTNKSFSVVVSATTVPAATFQWQRNGVSLANGLTGTGTLISGVTTATLSLASIDIADSGAYRCVVSTPCDITFSNLAVLNVTPGTFITSNPAPVIILVGSNAAFSITASGTGPITFQWQRNGVNVANGVQASGSIFAGTTTTTLAIAGAALGDTGNYRCTITSPCGVFNSSAAALVPAIDLGTASNNTLTGTVPVPTTGIRWFRFTTTQAAVDPDRFLDIHTLGSTLIDTEIGLYSGTGALLANNDDFDSPFRPSLLSFGQTSPGRSYPPFVPLAAAADGSLPAGTYFLAVGGFNTVFGNTSWVVNSTSVLTGNVIVTLIAGTAVNPCLSDVNNDGTIDGGDFTAFINSFGVGDPAIDPIADVNLDGVIDGNDFVAFINAFAAGC